MSKEPILNLSNEQQIKMPNSYLIKWTFSLTYMPFLNEFEEDMVEDMNVTPTICNIHSIVSIQNSLLSEMETNASTPPIQSCKIKIDNDNGETSLGTTSTSKFRRI